MYQVEDFINAGYDVFENEFCAKIETEDIEHAKTMIEPYANVVQYEIRHTMLHSQYERYMKEKAQQEMDARLQADPEAWAELPKGKRIGDLPEYQPEKKKTQTAFESWQVLMQYEYEIEFGRFGYDN